MEPARDESHTEPRAYPRLLDSHRGWERVKACSGEEKCSGGEMR